MRRVLHITIGLANAIGSLMAACLAMGGLFGAFDELQHGLLRFAAIYAVLAAFFAVLALAAGQAAITRFRVSARPDSPPRFALPRMEFADDGPDRP